MNEQQAKSPEPAQEAAGSAPGTQQEKAPQGQRVTRRGRRLLRSLIGIYVGLLLVLAGFVSGLVVGEQRAEAERTGAITKGRVAGDAGEYSGIEDIDFNLFWRVWETVQDKYVKQPVEDESLFRGAVAGIVSSLNDPYSVYFDPPTAQEFADELRGTFSGIGAEIGIKNDQLVIVAPLADSPAINAGLRPGDQIIAIDETSTSGMTIERAVSLIRGEKGTVVKLLIFRDVDGREPFEISIMRDTIIVKSVTWEMKHTPAGVPVGYVQMRQFNEETVPLFGQAIGDFQKQGMRGMILDLRGNPGGFLGSAIEVAGEWVGRDVVVIEQKRGSEQESYTANRRARLAGVPTVVLVNAGSASGSEIVAGALQDGVFATIVGETTFGKGSVQDYEELPDGSALKLTIAEWLTPKERAINEVGIEPDIEIELTLEDYNENKDPQLEKALELIESGEAADGI